MHLTYRLLSTVQCVMLPFLMAGRTDDPRYRRLERLEDYLCRRMCRPEPEAR